MDSLHGLVIRGSHGKTLNNCTNWVPPQGPSVAPTFLRRKEFVFYSKMAFCIRLDYCNRWLSFISQDNLIDLVLVLPHARHAYRHVVTQCRTVEVISLVMLYSDSKNRV